MAEISGGTFGFICPGLIEGKPRTHDCTSPYIKRALKQAGISDRITNHRFRASFANILNKKGVPPFPPSRSSCTIVGSRPRGFTSRPGKRRCGLLSIWWGRVLSDTPIDGRRNLLKCRYIYLKNYWKGRFPFRPTARARLRHGPQLAIRVEA